MAEGLDRNLLFALSVDDWFNDFITAISQIDPMWTKAYRLNKTEEVNTGTLDYRTLANDFRIAVKAAKTEANTSRVAKGSFAATFAGQGTDDETDASESSAKAKSRRRQKANKRKPDSRDASGTGKGKRRHSQTDSISSSRPRCRACGLRHHHTACFYLFPKKAPKTFIPSEIIKKRVEENLRDDTSLAEEVKRLQISNNQNKGKGKGKGKNKERKDLSSQSSLDEED